MENNIFNLFFYKKPIYKFEISRALFAWHAHKQAPIFLCIENGVVNLPIICMFVHPYLPGAKRWDNSQNKRKRKGASRLDCLFS